MEATETHDRRSGEAAALMIKINYLFFPGFNFGCQTDFR